MCQSLPRRVHFRMSNVRFLLFEWRLSTQQNDYSKRDRGQFHRWVRLWHLWEYLFIFRSFFNPFSLIWLNGLKEDSLSHYYQPLQVAINKDDKLVEKVASASECATKCDKETGDFHCRSFNFCPNSNQCYLSNSHLSLSTVTQDDLVCFHYSS